ncbi:MAG: TolC family protein [Muribaculaceae bacterium]
MKKILAATMFMAAALGVSAQATDSVTAGTRVPVIAPADTSVTLSLERCLEIALSDNPSIKVADMEITRYDYSRKEILGQLLPSVSFGVNYNRMLAKQVAYMNMDGFPSMGGGDGEEGDTPESRAGKDGDAGIKMGLDNSWSMGFNASLPLIAPQIWKSLKISDAQIYQQVITAQNSRLELVNNVKSAYYQLLLALDSKKTLEESYQMALFTADIYQKQYELGTASRYDVLRTSVQVKNVEPELAQADISIKRAQLQLSVLMGLSGHITIQPTVSLNDYEKTMLSDAMEATSLRHSSEANPQLLLLDAQTTLVSRNLDMQKAAWWPTLALSANYNWTSSSNGNPFANFRWNPYSVLGLTLNVPLFEGGQRYNRIRQARVQLDEMALNRQDLKNSVDMQIDLAVDNMNTNVKQVGSCAESVKQAVMAHDIASESFKIGATSYLELRDSELALTRSRLAYYQAIYNYLIARSELELLTGSFDLNAFTPAQ